MRLQRTVILCVLFLAVRSLCGEYGSFDEAVAAAREKYAKRDYAGALSAWTAAGTITRQPKNLSTVHWEKGNCCFAMKHYRDAANHYRETAQVKNGWEHLAYRARFREGICRKNLGEYREARECFRWLIRKENFQKEFGRYFFESSIVEYAQCCVLLHDFEEAEIHFRTCFAELTLAEYRTAMLLERSEFELKRGNAELAAGYLKEASGNPGAGKRFKARMESIRKKLLPYDQKGS